MWMTKEDAVAESVCAQKCFEEAKKKLQQIE